MASSCAGCNGPITGTAIISRISEKPLCQVCGLKEARLITATQREGIILPVAPLPTAPRRSDQRPQKRHEHRWGPWSQTPLGHEQVRKCLKRRCGHRERRPNLEALL